MSSLVGYIFLLFIVVIVPLLLGLYWIDMSIDVDKVAITLYIYIMGLFSMLAIFEICFFLAAIYYIKFDIISIVYTCILVGLSIVSMILSIKKKKSHDKFIFREKKWTGMDYVYFSVFLCLLLYQLYYAFFYSRSYMSIDGYVAFSSAAYSDNYIDLTHIYTGEYLIHGMSWLRRAIQAFNYFAAYLSYVSGINTSIVAHTIIYTGVVIIAYMVYYLMSCQLFKDRDNRFIFLSLLSILYIWGYHSHYSLSFRLLGPNDSGKAILAVILAPFMMTIMYRVIEVGYQLKIGFQLFVISIVACSFTLGGVYTFAALLAGLVLIPMIKIRSAKLLFYLLWGGIIPSVFAFVYLMYRYSLFR